MVEISPKPEIFSWIWSNFVESSLSFEELSDLGGASSVLEGEGAGAGEGEGAAEGAEVGSGG